MSRTEGVIYCDNCGVEITWAPYHPPEAGGAQARQFDYCCQECYQGLPCHCGERMEMEDERRAGGGGLPSVEGMQLY
ncbi:MAG: hypothetical protein JXA78_14750 [Anaerolineales bacterium]|nr:hypothetical protein [Anaerolineales bacterium]